MAPIGEVVLHTYFRSSCARRVEICLLRKDIAYRKVFIDIFKPTDASDCVGEQHSAEFTRRNPIQQVPLVEIDGLELWQSVAIMEYLEERCPEPAMLPRETGKRADVRRIVQLVVGGIQPMQNCRVLEQIDDSSRRRRFCVDSIRVGFDALEKLLSETSGRYCVGNQVTLADACLVGQVWNARLFGLDVDANYPTICNVERNLLLLPEFQATSPEKQPGYLDESVAAEFDDEWTN